MNNRLFIHHPAFRVISPLFVGAMVYVLVLLINNNVDQLNESFLRQELYVCIGLSYLIQELSRLLLVLMSRIRWRFAVWMQVVVQVMITVGITVCLVTALLTYYFTAFIGFTPSMTELLHFNIIFSMVSAIYVALYLSHQLLHKINTAKISIELEKRQAIQSDYQHYVQDINPQLLFQGLESLLVQMKLAASGSVQHDPDELIDVLSVVYRYMLGNKSRELVTIGEEVEVMQQMAYLFDFLPYRKVVFISEVADGGMVLPGAVLQLTQELVSITIPSDQLDMEVTLSETEDHFLLSAPIEDRIGTNFSEELVKQLNGSLRHYSELSITLRSTDEQRIVSIPKLFMATG